MSLPRETAAQSPKSQSRILKSLSDRTFLDAISAVTTHLECAYSMAHTRVLDSTERQDNESFLPHEDTTIKTLLPCTPSRTLVLPSWARARCRHDVSSADRRLCRFEEHAILLHGTRVDLFLVGKSAGVSIYTRNLTPPRQEMIWSSLSALTLQWPPKPASHRD